MNSVFFRLIDTKKIYFFNFWLLASDRKKLAFTRKMMDLPESEGAATGWYAYGDVTMSQSKQTHV